MGVLQGSIISITLFILKINSTADVIPSSIEKSRFVDDFSISYSSRNMASIDLALTNIQLRNSFDHSRME